MVDETEANVADEAKANVPMRPMLTRLARPTRPT